MMMIAGLAPDSNGAAVLWVDDQQGGQALADVEVTFGKGNSLKLFLLQIQQGSQPLPPDISREHGEILFTFFVPECEHCALLCLGFLVFGIKIFTWCILCI